MSKVAGAVIAVFSVCGGMMTMLSPVMGPYGEALTLVVSGVGLLASSSLVGSKLTEPTEVAEKA
jgi:hypothetical protein